MILSQFPDNLIDFDSAYESYILEVAGLQFYFVWMCLLQLFDVMCDCQILRLSVVSPTLERIAR
jgi:hypothetical protein